MTPARPSPSEAQLAARADCLELYRRLERYEKLIEKLAELDQKAEKHWRQLARMVKNEEEKQQGAPEKKIAAASANHAEDCATKQEATGQ